MKYDRQIIIALDFTGEKQCLRFLQQLDPALCRVKVGKELFTRCGPQLIRQIQDEGFEVFLDLKFHDIPNTVAAALRAAVDLGVWMVNIHAAGGRAMLEAGRAALHGPDAPLLIAVTVLTSMGQEDLAELGIKLSPMEQVLKMAELTADCGLDGVVCSAQEVGVLRSRHEPSFRLVTPGIRPAGDAAGDQKRILTPEQALGQGSDYLVIGRPVTQAENPAAKLDSIIADIRAAT